MPSKLVRDLIPDLIRESGGTPDIREVQGQELIEALLQKLGEEAREALEAKGPDDLMEELGDVLEVVDALCKHAGMNRTKLREMLVEKRRLKGGFDKGVILTSS